VPAVIIENSGYMEFLISLIVVCVLFAIVCTAAILLLKRSVKRYEQEK
jgi:membrane protein implicated in regulation of membrane protease activity